MSNTKQGGQPDDRDCRDEVVPPPRADALPRRSVRLRGGPMERRLHLCRDARSSTFLPWPGNSLVKITMEAQKQICRRTEPRLLVGRFFFAFFAWNRVELCSVGSRVPEVPFTYPRTPPWV